LLSRPQANQYPGFTRFTLLSKSPMLIFERLDAAAFKLENSLKRLIESLQKKDLTGTWDDSFVIRETNTENRTDEEPVE